VWLWDVTFKFLTTVDKPHTRSTPKMIVGAWSVPTLHNKYGLYCHLRGEWLFDRHQHFHVDAGCMGFIGPRDFFFQPGRSYMEELVKLSADRKVRVCCCVTVGIVCVQGSESPRPLRCISLTVALLG
jgi:hypothetical protein